MQEKLNDYNIIFKDKFSILSKIGIIIIFSIFCFIFSDNVKALSNVTIDYDLFDFRNEFVESASDQMLDYLDSVCDVTESERFITFGFSKKFETKYVIGYCLNSSEGREFFLSPRTATSNGVTHFAGYRVVSTMNRENFYTIGGNNGEVFHAQIDKNGDVTEFINGELDFIFPLYYTSVSENLTGTINYYDYISSLPIESTQVYQVPYYTTIDIYRRPAVSLADYDPHLIVSDNVINSYDVVFSSESDLITKSYSIDSSIYKNFILSFYPKENEKIDIVFSSDYKNLNDIYQGAVFDTKTYCDDLLIHEAEGVLFSGLTFGNLNSMCEGILRYDLSLSKDIPNYNPSQILNIDFISNFDSNLNIKYVYQDLVDVPVIKEEENIIYDDIYGEGFQYKSSFTVNDISNFEIRTEYNKNGPYLFEIDTFDFRILPKINIHYVCSSTTSASFNSEFDVVVPFDYFEVYRYHEDFLKLNSGFGTCFSDSDVPVIILSFAEDLLNYEEAYEVNLNLMQPHPKSVYFNVSYKPQYHKIFHDITDAPNEFSMDNIFNYLERFLNDFREVREIVNDSYNRFYSGLPYYFQFGIDFILIVLMIIVIIKVGART